MHNMLTCQVSYGMFHILCCTVAAGYMSSHVDQQLTIAMATICDHVKRLQHPSGQITLKKHTTITHLRTIHQSVMKKLLSYDPTLMSAFLPVLIGCICCNH